MKITIFLSLIVSMSFAQNSICGEMEYTYTTNLNYFYQEDYKMIFNDSVSYSEEINHEKVDKKLKKERANGKLTNKIIVAKQNKPSFYYNNNNEFYISEFLEKTILIVKEDSFDWDWDLHPETKKIGNFDCQKATIKFRGRDYTAWFTKQIPVKYGPWKFQGLPGLILEVYEDNDALHIVTNRISVNEKENCPINFDESKLKDALSIEKYLQKRKEKVKAKLARISSKLPKGSKPLVLDENCEDCNSGKLEIFNKEK